jgi:type IV pilus assembly protein PilP
MTHLTHKRLLIAAVMLGVTIAVCGKTTATESAGPPPVLYAMPRSPKTEKKPMPLIENEFRESASKQTSAVQDPIPQEDIENADDIFDNVDQPYEPISSLDPFAPLIQEKPPESSERRKPEKSRRILTPLEKMTLSQLKLVAVVMGENRKIAMVEEATGKGYEVKIGTYMGKNEGQVVDIQPDRIVVREMGMDFKGVVTERFQELKLHKADGGE